MPRLRLPPYAKELVARRRGGDHPWACVVGFTHEWLRPSPGLRHPMVMVPPVDYEPGAFDFSFLHGIAAHLVVDANGDSPFLSLAMELAAHAAPVEVHLRHVDGAFSRPLPLWELVWGARKPDRVRKAFAWPAGWSDEQMLDYDKRCAAYHRFEEYYMARTPGAAA